jgi:serine protease Do
MGVSIQDLTPELAETFGVKDIEGALITDVIPGSPADKAGLKKGDIAVECNNKKINRIQDFSRLVGTIPIGESVKLIVVRDRERKSFGVTVKEKEEVKKLAPEKIGPDIGIQIEELTPEVAQNFGYPETEQGVIIFQVEPRSAADEAGLKSGDVIKEVNRKPVNSLKDYRDTIKDSSLPEGILFFVNRKEGSFFVVVKEQ